MNPTGPRVDPAPAAAALIYVVEDDDAITKLVLAALHEFGFATEAFRHGEALLRRLRTEHPDLCIVDLGLPDIDGIELVRQITTLSSSGVLILTGRGHTVDRVMGLELGGDDYMVKPFEPRELVARVRSVLRRRAAGSSGGAGSGAGSGVGRGVGSGSGSAAGSGVGSRASMPGQPRRHASFLDWRLDCAAHMLRAADGSEHLLGTAEAQVLRAFIERPFQILTREQLVGHHNLSPLDRSIDVRISRLRKKLESDPQNPKIIKTVYGAGYMFSVPVTWL